jgi:hypothetical protein
MLLVPGSPVPHEVANETSKLMLRVTRGTAWRSRDHFFAVAELRRQVPADCVTATAASSTGWLGPGGCEVVRFTGKYNPKTVNWRDAINMQGRALQRRTCRDHRKQQGRYKKR